MKKLPFLLLTLLGCSPDSGQQVRYYDTAVVDSTKYVEAFTAQDTQFVTVSIDPFVQFPMEYDRAVPQRLVIGLHCRSHGPFSITVQGVAADTLRESLKLGSTVGVSCTPYQRLGYGTQIRHELLLKSN